MLEPGSRFGSSVPMRYRSARSMAPGPTISRYERPFAERRPGESTREPPAFGPGVLYLSVSYPGAVPQPSSADVSVATCTRFGGTPAAAREPGVELRLLDLHVRERPAQVLQSRPGQPRRVFCRQVQLDRHTGRAFGEAEADHCGHALVRRHVRERAVQPF